MSQIPLVSVPSVVQLWQTPCSCGPSGRPHVVHCRCGMFAITRASRPRCRGWIARTFSGHIVTHLEHSMQRSGLRVRSSPSSAKAPAGQICTHTAHAVHVPVTATEGNTGSGCDARYTSRGEAPNLMSESLSAKPVSRLSRSSPSLLVKPIRNKLQRDSAGSGRSAGVRFANFHRERDVRGFREPSAPSPLANPTFSIVMVLRSSVSRTKFRESLKTATTDGLSFRQVAQSAVSSRAPPLINAPAAMTSASTREKHSTATRAELASGSAMSHRRGSPAASVCAIPTGEYEEP